MSKSVSIFFSCVFIHLSCLLPRAGHTSDDMTAFAKASQLPNFDTYSINFIWLKQRSDGFFFDSIFPADQRTSHYETLKSWRDLNPEAQITVWYDDETDPDGGVMRDKEAVSGYNISFTTIREVPLVANNPSVFRDPLPTFFRIDLLKLIACFHSLDHGSAWAIHSDFDVTPLSQKQLFDHQTLEDLDIYGFVVAAWEQHLGYENSFHIFKNDPKMRKAFDLSLVQLNLERARFALKHGFFPTLCGSMTPLDPFAPMRQIVFEGYHDAACLNAAYHGYAQLTCGYGSGYEVVDLENFDPALLNRPRGAVNAVNVLYTEGDDHRNYIPDRISLPKKAVIMPPPRGVYPD